MSLGWLQLQLSHCILLIVCVESRLPAESGTRSEPLVWEGLCGVLCCSCFLWQQTKFDLVARASSQRCSLALSCCAACQVVLCRANPPLWPPRLQPLTGIPAPPVHPPASTSPDCFPLAPPCGCFCFLQRACVFVSENPKYVVVVCGYRVRQPNSSVISSCKIIFICHERMFYSTPCTVLWLACCKWTVVYSAVLL